MQQCLHFKNTSVILHSSVLYDLVACCSLHSNNVINQFSHAVKENFANRHWQTNGNQGLAANTEMNFNFFLAYSFLFPVWFSCMLQVVAYSATMQ